MGFFKEIFVKETKTGKLVNITDLDKEHYESFLECTTKIKAAYIAALERRGAVPTGLSNCNIPLVNDMVCPDCKKYDKVLKVHTGGLFCYRCDCSFGQTGR